MYIARTLQELASFHAKLTLSGSTLSLVPTMGGLHAGHEALLAAAQRGGAAAVASIFVNPLQFRANEDYARYPRSEASDLAMLEAAGCALAWIPSVGTMYPAAAVSEIDVAGPALGWEGEARPGHFRGVATVVAKLFGQVRPARAFFGEKDWQQLQVVRRMTEDLYLPVEIIAVPTVRAPDGLALSSRNRQLTAADRKVAPKLYATLLEVARELASGARVTAAIGRGAAALEHAGFHVSYFALVDAHSLVPLDAPRAPARLIVATSLGEVHLIDNIAVA